MKNYSAFLSIALLFTALVTLPGCALLDWFRGQGSNSVGTGTAVITFDGKPMLTSDQFDKKLEMIYQARQGLDRLIAQMPPEQQLEVYEQLAEGLVAEQLILDYVKRQKLDQNPEYKDVAAQAHRQLDVDLAVRGFQMEMAREMQELSGKITDEEAQKFYDDNKERLFKRAPFLLNGEEGKAKGAADKTKAAGEKKKSVFAKFEDVRDLVKQVMMQERMPAIYAEKMAALKQQRNVVINKDYFKKYITLKEEANPLMAEQTSVAPQAEATSSVKAA